MLLLNDARITKPNYLLPLIHTEEYLKYLLGPRISELGKIKCPPMDNEHSFPQILVVNNHLIFVDDKSRKYRIKLRGDAEMKLGIIKTRSGWKSKSSDPQFYSEKGLCGVVYENCESGANCEKVEFYLNVNNVVFVN